MLVLLVLMLPISTEVFTFLAFRDMGTRKKGQQQVKTNKTEILSSICTTYLARMRYNVTFLKWFKIRNIDYLSLWHGIIPASMEKLSAIVWYCCGNKMILYHISIKWLEDFVWIIFFSKISKLQQLFFKSRWFWYLSLWFCFFVVVDV